jgi:hypothetical protein
MKYGHPGWHRTLLAGIALAAVTIPVAMATPAAKPAAAAPAARVAPGGEVAFDELPAYVGSEVIVSTKARTVRRGLLTGASSISINLTLVPAEGGFAMSMPREHITKVVLAPAADAEPKH